MCVEMKMSNKNFKVNPKLSFPFAFVLVMNFVACTELNDIRVPNSVNASSGDTIVGFSNLFLKSCSPGEIVFVSAFNAIFQYQCVYDSTPHTTRTTRWDFLNGPPAGCYKYICKGFSGCMSPSVSDVFSNNLCDSGDEQRGFCFVPEINAFCFTWTGVIRSNVYKSYEELVQNVPCGEYSKTGEKISLGVKVPVSGVEYMCVKSRVDGSMKWLPADEVNFLEYFWGETSGFMYESYVDSVNCENERFADSVRHAEVLQGHGSMTDIRDGQIYKTVTLGSQTWMAENLNYRYMQPIGNLDSSSFCYDNDPANCAQYGRLYLIESNVDSICPDGWRLPSKDDWDVLLQKIKWSRLWTYEVCDADIRSTFKVVHEGANLISYESDSWTRDGFGFSMLGAGYMRFRDKPKYYGLHYTTYFDYYQLNSMDVKRDELPSTTGRSVRCILGRASTPVVSSSSYTLRSSSSSKSSIKVTFCTIAGWCANQDDVECVKKRSTVCPSLSDVYRTMVLEPCGCW